MDCAEDCDLFIAIHAHGFGQLNRILNIAAERQKLGRKVLVVTSSGDPNSVEKIEIINGVKVQTILPFYSVAGERDSDRMLECWDAAEKGVLLGPEMMRRQRLVRIFEALKPSVVVVEGFPFLLEKMEHTVNALIDRRDKLGLPTVFFASSRDIVGHEQVGWTEDGEIYLPKISSENPDYKKMLDNLSLFNHLLIHADPGTGGTDIDVDNLPIPHSFTGMVVADMPQRSFMPDSERHVLFSVGGGSYGEKFPYIALEAMRQTSLPNAWHFILGQKSREGLIHEFAAKAASYVFSVHCPEAGMLTEKPDIIIDRHRTDFKKLLAESLVSLSNTGYNSVAEALKAGARLFGIPASRRDEKGGWFVHTEQHLRAAIMAHHGLMRTIDPRELSPVRLAQTLEEMVAQSPPNHFADMNGARRTAEIMTQVSRYFVATKDAWLVPRISPMAIVND